MKKFLLVVLVGALALPVFQSCKKGPNDPAISFKSRSARLVGEWKIFKGVEVQNNAGTITNINIDNSTYSETSGGTTVTGVITTEISIKKDGTYTWKQTLTIAGTTEIDEQEGTWSFLGANSANTIKNKQCVAFQCNKSTNISGSTTTVSTYTGWWPTVYNIDELKSKEIILIRDYSYTGSSTDTESVTYTLQPK
ncbi:MAG: hypothetical protein WCM76_10660 [Bacteroidota bacterium]